MQFVQSLQGSALCAIPATLCGHGRDMGLNQNVLRWQRAYLWAACWLSTVLTYCVMASSLLRPAKGEVVSHTHQHDQQFPQHCWMQP